MITNPEVPQAVLDCGHNDEFLHNDGSTIECNECGTIWDTGARR